MSDERYEGDTEGCCEPQDLCAFHDAWLSGLRYGLQRRDVLVSAGEALAAAWDSYLESADMDSMEAALEVWRLAVKGETP